MRFALMIEGQEDVTWDDWQALAATCERLGFEALFRSDHYLSVHDRRERGALDAWGTICALAVITTSLRLGTLVSPATFRHPSVLAKLAVTADRISGGRIELGLGTGWWEGEHTTYGFEFPPLGVRMDRLAEQLEIVHGSWGPGPFTFAGEHWIVEELDALPKPLQRPHPPVVMGGTAGPRSLALAARFATEYNYVYAVPEEAAGARRRLDAACEAIGRDPATLSMSLMNGLVIGVDPKGVARQTSRLLDFIGNPPDAAYLTETWLRGTPDQIVERLASYAEAGVERVFLQHQLVDDNDALELFMSEVAPHLAG